MNPVITHAKTVHQTHWRMTHDTSEGTKLAKAIERYWQDAVRAMNDENIVCEYVVGALNERIDVFDRKQGVAYEMKASPNNTHMEFYRDVFKVLILKEVYRQKVEKLVFMTPCSSSEKIQRKMGGVARELLAKQGIDVVFEGL